MKKLLIISLCFTLSFLSIGPTASNVYAATSENEVPVSVESNIQEVFNYAADETEEIVQELEEEFNTAEDTELEVSNLNVQNDRIIIESKVSTYNYDVDTTLEIQPEENTAQYNITYEENGDLIEKEYDLNINVIDDENFIIEFIDKETGEITIYDSSVVSASAVPYVANIIGSQVVRLAIKGLAKKSIKVASNMGKILKHNSRGVLFEGNASKGWKHIKNGHILGKGAKKGDTLFPKNLSESQIKNIIMESLQKGTYKGQAANGYKSYEYNLNKYGINKMKVIVDKDGMIVTAYPLSGKSVIKVK
ncbi:MAG: hypothetical protein C6W54_14005 [Bacillaceae bacterium]|nr:MAG: hypothetical protein C6W54_14005 [Bacillaceae bacterium]